MLLKYSLSASGTTYSGSTAFLSSSTTFTPVRSFSLPAVLVLSSTIDTSGASRTGINLLDVGLEVSNPFSGTPPAGALIWASNNALHDVFGQTTTGKGAIDEVTQTYDPATRTLVMRLDGNVAGTTTLDYYTQTAGVLAVPRHITNGEVDITFSADGRSLTGRAAFYGNGYVEPTTSAWSATFSGSTTDPTVAALDLRTLGLGAKTAGVYRFFDTKFGTHFFTASAAERDQVLATRRDLSFEGVGLQSVDPAAKDPNAVPVYRFFDTAQGTHFFTASASERDTVQATRADLKFEGVGFYEHATQRSGDSPVFRFFDKRYGTHFYTGDAGERATILATRPDLADEGVAFYAPAAG